MSILQWIVIQPISMSDTMVQALQKGGLQET